MPHTLFLVQHPPNIRIAVADDDPNFVASVCGLLTLEKDFQVVASAGDGREVLEAIEEHAPDILLLDLCMRGSAGWTALKKLWTSLGRTKVIMLAASKDKNQFVQAM